MFFTKKSKKGYLEIEQPLAMDTTIDESREEIKKEKGKESQKRLWWLIILSFSILILRTTYLQVVKGEHYQKLANNNRIHTGVIKAPRGVIKDSQGAILARNIPGFEVFMVPANLPSERREREAVLAELVKIIDLEEEVKKRILDIPLRDQRNYPLKDKVTQEKALAIIEHFEKLPGIYVSQSPQREYPQGIIFSHLIGYEGKITQQELEEKKDYSLIDNIGKVGLELVYEKELRGKHGQHRFEVDSAGNIEQDLGKIQPVAGKELVLNINAELQKKVFEVLSEVLTEDKEATGATVIIVDPRNGKVLSLISLPSFDNNSFTGGIKQEEYNQLINSDRKPLLNRALSGEYPPGSVYKLVIAVAGLEEKIIHPGTTIDCQGRISVGEWHFPDWKTHGLTDIRKAIAESCDVFFYALGGGYGEIKGLGVNRMGQYAGLFGYGEKTDIDLTGERAGKIPGKTWKFKKLGEKWYLGDDYHMAIGQGFVLVTPIQVAMATATIANNGTLYRPQVVNKVINPQTKEEKEISPKIIDNLFIEKKNLTIVREGMRQAVTGEKGSARQLNSLKVAVAGKTGTAQFGTEDKTHAWFTSFAPYENPELAMLVLIEGGGEGSSWAVPVTKKVYQWYFDEEMGNKKED